MVRDAENSYETDNTTGSNHEGDMANTPVERLTAASIVGDAVEDLEGEKLGTIDNLMVNITTGMVPLITGTRAAILLANALLAPA